MKNVPAAVAMLVAVAVSTLPPTAVAVTMSAAGRCSCTMATTTGSSRRSFVRSLGAASIATSLAIRTPSAAHAAAKTGRPACGDIETCREIGYRKVTRAALHQLPMASLLLPFAPPPYLCLVDAHSLSNPPAYYQKDEQDAIDNPTFKLADNVRYKKMFAGTGSDAVSNDSVVDVVFSISQSRGGAYMYSKGMGYEPSEEGLGRKDTGETYRVRMGSKDIPVGIQAAMVGMKKGEKRRVELPSAVKQP